MRILFAVFLGSLVALIGTLLALRRHVRKHHARPGDAFVFPGTSHEDTRTL